MKNNSILESQIRTLNPKNAWNYEMVPKFLYKVLSMDDWAKSQAAVHLPSMDADFVHLSTEEQLDRIIAKYWSDVSEYVVLKIETEKLTGKLVLEANSEGMNQYYHLYEGTIPLSAIVETKIIRT